MITNYPLSTKVITTEIFAEYIYDCILELEKEEIVTFNTTESIESYIDSIVDFGDMDVVYTNILNSNYGLNYNFGVDEYFDSEEDLKKYVEESNMILINDSFAVSDISDKDHVSELVLSLLEEKND